MDEAICPYCTNEISDEAHRCPHCGEWFNQSEGNPFSARSRAQMTADMNADALASRLEHRKGADTFGGCLFIPFLFGGLALGIWLSPNFWIEAAVWVVIWVIGWKISFKASDVAFEDRMKRQKTQNH